MKTGTGLEGRPGEKAPCGEKQAFLVSSSFCKDLHCMICEDVSGKGDRCSSTVSSSSSLSSLAWTGCFFPCVASRSSSNR
jgi:hypothetical protein